MNIIELINKKREAEILTASELKYIVDGFSNEEIKDYQMSSFLMTVCINGMNEEETINFTKAMIDGGDKLDLSTIQGIKVDKHSTGGVGDKTTLIVAPLVASCGVKVAKMSGRGLGHTGGTIDKLESISGFKANLNHEEFIKQIDEIGVAIATTTLDLVPADKKIYALRDVTGTVSSLPLIAASIMSKKIATGADKIVLDVKAGKGALIKTEKEAVELAKIMIKIGNHFNKKTVAIITNMNHPLGNNVGNALELIEAIDILKGNGNAELSNLCIVLASYMVSLGKDISYEEAQKLVRNNLYNGMAYKKLEELIKYQKGDISLVKVSPNIVEVKSSEEGYISNIDALQIGKLSMNLGSGRKQKDDLINYEVGIVLKKQIGDFVEKDDILATVYLGDKEIDLNDIRQSFTMSNTGEKTEPMIFGKVE